MCVRGCVPDAERFGGFVVIRPATPRDAPAIAAIWNRVIEQTTITFTPDPKSADDVAKLIAADQPFLVTQTGDAVTGFAYCGAFRAGQGYRHTAELSVYLRDEAAGQGVGRALVDALCDLARADGKHVMMAGCSGENSAAIAFFEVLGFAKLAVLRQVGFKFDRWIDLVLMQKML